MVCQLVSMPWMLVLMPCVESSCSPRTVGRQLWCGVGWQLVACHLLGLILSLYTRARAYNLFLYETVDRGSAADLARSVGSWCWRDSPRGVPARGDVPRRSHGRATAHVLACLLRKTPGRAEVAHTVATSAQGIRCDASHAAYASGGRSPRGCSAGGGLASRTSACPPPWVAAMNPP